MGYEDEIFENFFLMMLPTAIIGARIWYVIFEWRQYEMCIRDSPETYSVDHHLCGVHGTGYSEFSGFKALVF